MFNRVLFFFFFFFFNDTATTEIYTLSLHDALPICALLAGMMAADLGGPINKAAYVFGTATLDRKSTRLNSSHGRESRMPSSA